VVLISKGPLYLDACFFFCVYCYLQQCVSYLEAALKCLCIVSDNNYHVFLHLSGSYLLSIRYVSTKY